MEYVDGETVDEWVRAKPRGWQEILDVFVAAGRGLAAAHAAGIIHRDLKPQNVMIGRDGSVRVMDFGLAQLIIEDDSASRGRPVDEKPTGSGEVSDDEPPDRRHPTVTRATKTGALLGTPAYMAPEQWRGEPIDARADQFSFCVALHEALYGVRPTLSHIEAGPGATTASKEPSGPQRRGAVPRWLRDVLNRALAPDRERRFASMDHLLASLTRARARTRRRISALAAAMVVTVATLTTWRLSHARAVDCTPPRDRMTAAWPPAGGSDHRRLSIQAALLASGAEDAGSIWERLSAALDDYVGRWGAMYRETCESTHVRHQQSPELLDLRMRCLDDRLDEVRALTEGLASAHELSPNQALAATSEMTPVSQCADVHSLQSATPLPKDERTVRAVQDLQKSLRSVEAQFDVGQYNYGLAQALRLRPAVEATGYKPLLGDLLEKIGRFQTEVSSSITAEGTTHDALVAAIAGGDYVTAAKAASMLAYILGSLESRPKEAHEWAAVGRALLDQAGPGHSRIRGWLDQGEAGTFLHERHFERALALFRQARLLKAQELGPDHPDVGLSFNSELIPLYKLGRRTEALAASDHALAIFLRRGGPVGSALSNRGEILRVLGRTDEAKDALERAMRTDLSDVRQADALTNLGHILAASDTPEQAIPLLERALHTEELHNLDPDATAETRFALASVLWSTGGDRRRALTLARAARKTYDRLEMSTELAEVDAWLAKHNGRRKRP
jgi:tetratricopeptide (TPR) repeat protein